jgi:uncharacterized membrane protein YhaH (DUF805 family)
MTFGEAVYRCLAKYMVFTGRARRGEFWWFMLLYGGAVLVAGTATAASPALTAVAIAVVVVLSPPALAVTVRRLHDVGVAGWALILAVPLIGQLVLIAWLIRPGLRRLNRHGPPAGEERELILLFAR